MKYVTLTRGRNTEKVDIDGAVCCRKSRGSNDTHVVSIEYSGKKKTERVVFECRSGQEDFCAKLNNNGVPDADALVADANDAATSAAAAQVTADAEKAKATKAAKAVV